MVILGVCVKCRYAFRLSSAKTQKQSIKMQVALRWFDLICTYFLQIINFGILKYDRIKQIALSRQGNGSWFFKSLDWVLHCNFILTPKMSWNKREIIWFQASLTVWSINSCFQFYLWKSSIKPQIHHCPGCVCCWLGDFQWKSRSDKSHENQARENFHFLEFLQVLETFSLNFETSFYLSIIFNFLFL